ncbi:MAG TPA: flavodoxin domain-containing protein [Longimicrobium sp.]|nr:flavodoxin domain-containing protein [Longimicrobium sp.]
MASILVVYGTTEGHTRKIAHFVGHVARRLGHAATVLDASLDPVPAEHDAVIVAASVHHLRHQSAVMHFAAEHRHLLNALPTAFFSVSLAAALDDPHHQVEAREVADELLAETRWQPQMVRLVAGALLYSKYDWMKRALMQMIARHDGRDTDTSRDWEYTDWERLRGDVEEFLARLPAAAPEPAPPAEAAEPAAAGLAAAPG